MRLFESENFKEMVFFIVDNHPLVRNGYSLVLKEKYPNAEIHVCSASDFTTASLDGLNHVDFFILDYNFGKNIQEFSFEYGFDLARMCRAKFPLSKIIIITAHEESLLIYNLHKKLSPEGFLAKSDITCVILHKAICHIIAVGRYYSAKVVECIKAVSQKEILLQDYNLQILLLLAQGLKIREISDTMSVSEGMIQKRIVIMKDAFQVKDNGGLVRAAKIAGFV